MAVPVLLTVDQAVEKTEHLLDRARTIKGTGGIEPRLPSSEFKRAFGLNPSATQDTKNAQYAVISIAARRVFYKIIASTHIDSPKFVDMWNLLDILLVCGDDEQCETGLMSTLFEELLDSQSIDDCRVIFGYLESRRQQLIAKHFGPKQQKNLVTLRSCSELLRRLSRAEDAVFCGRVFIFLFQSFPLGERGWVNQRGDFHVENVTTYESQTPPEGDKADRSADQINQNQSQTPASADVNMEDQEDAPLPIVSTPGKDVGREKDSNHAEDTIDEETGLNRLYPVFWALQEVFSNPPRVADQPEFAQFKNGLEATIERFKAMPKIKQARNLDDKRGVKRKHGESHTEFASIFNPKYLTSQDLFKLELSDLAFQRHVLVQGLILIEFLLSLTEKARKRWPTLPNRHLQFGINLSEEDTEWAIAMKARIAAYLQEGPEGKFYYRMVDTVLSRDKNWVFWKMENCPPIVKDALTVEQFFGANTGAEKTFAQRRMRAAPMGTLDLRFLSDAGGTDATQGLGTFARQPPLSAEKYVKGAQGAELDLEMATAEEEKSQLQDTKASQTWRALRVASRTKLGTFNNVDDDIGSLSKLLEPDATEDGKEEDKEQPGQQENKDEARGEEGYGMTKAGEGSAAPLTAPIDATNGTEVSSPGPQRHSVEERSE
ncbi:hypothetical protein P152DRAFT_473590 [Eremomyces bilateralis CBS 781.70]|uniref:Nuclear matrix protein n=1 Tax=Eremomyces bilateralis CBS 781.70 TaxID=1392243 RepID=A0A6G1G4U9_9PEZI|nr:uncharacterized protein P152DRAFT_473590 [Eremomyces bilateralis CBS 781.70]KAF1813074.1 hypothetical protein P152DRAFT_473590 [Eremomyces bilateralis CBS 781.70]